MLNTGEFPVYAGEESVGTVVVSQNGLMTVFDCACAYKSPDILRLAAVCPGGYVPLGVVMPLDNDVLHLHKRFSRNALEAIGYCDAVSYRLIRPGETAGPAQTPVPPAPEESRPEMKPPPEAAPEPEPEAEPALTEAAPAEPDVPAANAPASGDLANQLLSALLEMTSKAKADAAENEKDLPPGEAAPPAAGGWRPAENPAALFTDPDIAEICRSVTNALVMEQEDTIRLAIPVSPEEPFSMMPVFCFGSPKQIGGGDYIVFTIKDGYLTV